MGKVFDSVRHSTLSFPRQSDTRNFSYRTQNSKVLCVFTQITFLTKSKKECWSAYWPDSNVTKKKKRMLKVEQEPQNHLVSSLMHIVFCYRSPLSWYPGAQVEHLSVGQLASQLAHQTWSTLSSTLGKCWWDTGGWTWEGSKLSLPILSFLNRSVPLLGDGPLAPPSHFSTPCSLTWLYSQPDTKSLWACFAISQKLCVENAFLSNPAGTLLMPTVYENWSDYSSW